MIIDMMKREAKAGACLSHHNIQPGMRKKMIDWMIEVFGEFNCDIQTFFKAVSIMDTFLSKSHNTYQNKDIFLIGTTSIFIASKFVDNHPLKMDMIIYKIAHKELTEEEIRNKEKEILRTINFEIDFPTVLDFIEYHFANFIAMSNFSLSNMQWDQIKRLYDFSKYMAMMIYHEYNTLNYM